MICKIDGKLKHVPSSIIHTVDENTYVYGGKEKMCAIARRDGERINKNNKRKVFNSQIKLSVSGGVV